MIASGIFNDAVEFSSVQMYLMYPISQMEDENAALFCTSILNRMTGEMISKTY